MHVTAFDLNLLLVFDALWTERHVTRAARRVGLTQPAMSHALKRLRASFEDPLFQTTRRGLVPTTRAFALAGPLGAALATVRDAVEGGRPFTPAALQRTFTIGTSDYAELVLLPRLAAYLQRHAPGVELVVRPAASDMQRALASGEHDLVVGPVGERNEGVLGTELFHERFVCLLRGGHPAARQKLTLERFLALSHVLISPLGAGEAVVDVELRRLGKARRVAVRVPHFLSAPLVVAESDYIITLPERVAQALAASHGLVVRAPPLTLPGFVLSQLWHSRNDAEPAQRWLRDAVARVAAGARQARARPSRARSSRLWTESPGSG
jgi:DNA-binding transcriptional LysR family regulator